MRAVAVGTQDELMAQMEQQDISVHRRTIQALISNDRRFDFRSIANVSRFFRKCPRTLIDWPRELLPIPVDPCQCPVCIGERQQHISQPGQSSVGGRLLRCADSDPVVVKSVLLGWGLDRLLADLGKELEYVWFDWTDRILLELGRSIDIAIYNRRRTEDFIDANPRCNLRILGDCGVSMNGNNFYVLAKGRPFRKPLTRSEFLSGIKGSYLVASRSSNLHWYLMQLLGCSNEILRAHNGVSIVDVNFSTLDQAFFHENVLLMAGQDWRFIAQHEGEHQEVANVASFVGSQPKRELTTDWFRANATNCVVAHTKIFAYIDYEVLRRLISLSWNQFLECGRKKNSYELLCDRLLVHLRRRGIADLAAKYTIRNILFHSFAFGVPPRH